MRYTELFKIDGQSLPEPSEAVDIQFTDVESDDSGNDEMGVYHREVLRHGVLSCTLSYNVLSNSEYHSLLTMIQGKTTFQFTCPISSASTDVTQTTTRTCYISNYGAALQRLKRGIWRNFELDIQEC